ncbi:MAG TPA: hypothetical protein DEA78_15030, partial [Cyanobacteria bacterium UBA11159]|nr:hypothetical protein [Cyanobacteria bacterium UBA11159]
MKKPEDIARKALNFLKDEKVEPVFLSFAIPGFVNLGEAGAKYAPQDWQIDGIVAAIDDSYLKVKSVAFWQLAQYDAQELKLVLKKPEDIALKAVNILSDEKVDPYIRRNAAFALGKLGEAGAKYAPDILNFLKDEKVKPYIRMRAAGALIKLGEAGAKYAPDILNFFKDEKVDPGVRSIAAYALGNLGEA